LPIDSKRNDEFRIVFYCDEVVYKMDILEETSRTKNLEFLVYSLPDFFGSKSEMQNLCNKLNTVIKPIFQPYIDKIKQELRIELVDYKNNFCDQINNEINNLCGEEKQYDQKN
jgi:undecaprenyl pyrophosphate synthase